MNRSRISRLVRDVREIGDPSRRRDAALRLRRRVRSLREAARQRLERARALLARGTDHPGVGRSDFAVSLFRLALAIAALDVPVQATINAAAFGWNGVRLWAAAVALPSLLAAVAHGAFLALTDDDERPRRSVRLARRWSTITFAISASAGAFLLALRVVGADQAGFVASAASVALIVVGEGFPITSGAFACWAYHIGAPMRAERTIATVDAELEALGEAEEELGDIIGPDTPDEPQPVASELLPVGPSPQPRTITAARISAMLLIFAAARASAELCAWEPDRSASPDSVHWEAAMSTARNSLAATVRALGCDTLVVIPIDAERDWAAKSWVVLPQAAASPAACGIEILHLSPAQRALLEYDAFRQHFLEVAHRRCTTWDSVANRKVAAAWERAEAEVRRLVDAYHARGQGMVTDIAGAIRSALALHAAWILVHTDLLQSGMGARLPPLGRTRIIFLAVPAGQAWGGPVRTKAAFSMWRTAIPSSIILPYSDFGAPSFWIQIEPEHAMQAPRDD